VPDTPDTPDEGEWNVMGIVVSGTSNVNNTDISCHDDTLGYTDSVPNTVMGADAGVVV